MRTHVAVALSYVVALGCSATPRPTEQPISIGSTLVARNEQDQPITLRVDGIEPDATDAEIVLYQVSFHAADGAWRNYCLPDAAGKTTAIALEGGWDELDRHIATDSITFACTNGALAKCVRWGYKPWKVVNGVSLADYHQTCVHVVRADYCGDGRPHTRDGTRIDVYDQLGIQARDTRPGMVFEAAWGPRGAVYVSAPRLGAPAAAIAAECPERLHGRTPMGGPPLTESQIKERWPDALIFTESYAGPAP